MLFLHYSSGIVELHPIFSPKDFLEVIIRVNNPNFSFVAGGGAEEEGGEVEVDVSLGLMKVQMNVRSLFLLVSVDHKGWTVYHV